MFWLQVARGASTRCSWCRGYENARRGLASTRALASVEAVSGTDEALPSEEWNGHVPIGVGGAELVDLVLK